MSIFLVHLDLVVAERIQIFSRSWFVTVCVYVFLQRCWQISGGHIIQNGMPSFWILLMIQIQPQIYFLLSFFILNSRGYRKHIPIVFSIRHKVWTRNLPYLCAGMCVCVRQNYYYCQPNGRNKRTSEREELRIENEHNAKRLHGKIYGWASCARDVDRNLWNRNKLV